MLTDPISDLIIRLKNAADIDKKVVILPHSNMKEAILKLLKDEGFVDEFKTIDNEGFKMLEVRLPGYKFKVERISKPGRRIYAKKKEIPKILTGEGVVIVSTPSGLMKGDDARRAGVGGELIMKIWQ